ncbi:MAG: HAD hydrolase-like protein [Treponema sp.]|nr:HAD hydrolase-like protein [Treponema sp.]
MTVYKIPQKTEAIVFDIDGTLYTSDAYVFEQVDVQIRHFAHLRGIPEDEARRMIGDYRREWAAAHNGAKISLGNTFPAFGVPIETSIKWRDELLNPEQFLKEDSNLQKTLCDLQKKYRLICVTNNPVKAARRTLKAIGVDHLLPFVVGLDTCNKSKPSREMLDAVFALTGVPFSACLSVGDRYDIDLALPLELGMGAVLVQGVEDVYRLPELL